MPEQAVVRTYEIAFKGGRVLRVDIPETWKVTFGPIAGAKGYEGGGFAFRAWEAETKQRLLLTNVIGFRDCSLTVRRRAVRKYGSKDWIEDDGSWTGIKALDVEKRWAVIDDDTTPLDTEPEDPADAAMTLTIPRAMTTKRGA